MVRGLEGCRPGSHCSLHFVRATVPVRAISTMLTLFSISMKSSMRSEVSQIWIIIRFLDMSTIWACIISQFSMMSRLFSLLYLTLMSMSSRLMDMLSLKVLTLMTSIFLLSCFSICSIVRSSPLETMVMADIPLSAVSPTTRESILKFLREKRPATLESTPALFSTNTE